MPTKEVLIQNILDFLNFPEAASFEEIRRFLLEKHLCRCTLIVGENDQKYYSLFFKSEILERLAQGLPVDTALAQSLKPVDNLITYTVLTDSAYYRDRVVFPDSEGAMESDFTARSPVPALSPTTGTACKLAFRSVAIWFQSFMLGCSAGVVDVAALNKFKSTRKLVLEFQQARDPMNPMLSPVGILEDENDGVLERVLLVSWIYPFIFSGTGETLARIRRCRQCGTFFKGVRLNASFCTTKCRMAWNYANRT